MPDSISMEVKHITITDILMDKPDPKDRTISREFCENLARSIEAQGLLYEPYVRPASDNPGKFRVIAGRHRMIACKTFLKWTEMPCKVVPDSMSDEEVKAIEIADNLWRNNLDEGQLKRALAEWHSIYVRTHPITQAKAVGTKRQKLVEEKVAEAEARGETVDEAAREAIVEAVAAETKPFSRVLQETLKVSPATAGRLARVAKNLEPEQIDVLEKQAVTNDIYDKLAGLGSKDLIDKAIALIASGMDHAEAVRQAAVAKHKRAKSTKKGGRESKPTTEMTDEEWLRATCDPLLKSLNKKSVFRRDAILYRRLTNMLARFKTGAQGALQEAKSPEGNGGLFSLIYRVSNVAPPGFWTVCPSCSGTGKDKETSKVCGECLGAAFKVKLQN